MWNKVQTSNARNLENKLFKFPLQFPCIFTFKIQDQNALDFSPEGNERILYTTTTFDLDYKVK